MFQVGFSFFYPFLIFNFTKAMDLAIMCLCNYEYQ